MTSWRPYEWKWPNEHWSGNALYKKLRKISQEHIMLGGWFSRDAIKGKGLGRNHRSSQRSGSRYLQFLVRNLLHLITGVSLWTRWMWFLHDGAPVHFTMAVWDWICRHYPGRSIGCSRGSCVVATTVTRPESDRFLLVAYHGKLSLHFANARRLS